MHRRRGWRRCDGWRWWWLWARRGAWCRRGTIAWTMSDARPATGVANCTRAQAASSAIAANAPYSTVACPRSMTETLRIHRSRACDDTQQLDHMLPSITGPTEWAATRARAVMTGNMAAGTNRNTT